jgi:polysaccharide export outer membrane protein
MLKHCPASFLLIALTLGVSLPGTAARKEKSPAVPQSAAPEPDVIRPIGPGDRLQITVTRETDLSKEYLVDAAGQLTMSLLGVVPVKGMTPAQLQSDLRTRLARYVREPEVHVAAFQRIAIAGGVHTPGTLDFPKDQPVRLMDAISRAGGFVELAHKDRVLVLRRAGAQPGTQSFQVDVASYLKKGKVENNPTLEPNDLIYVDVATPRGERQNMLEKALPFLRLLL